MGEIIIKNSYSYSPKKMEQFPRCGIKRIFDLALKNKMPDYTNIINMVLSYSQSLAKITFDEINPYDPYWNNGWIGYMDAALLYTFTAHFKPKYFMEVGSGNSTKFVARAIRDHNLLTNLISIDPQPRAEIDGLCHKIIRKPLEAVNLSIFEDLTPADIFVIDSSHLALPGSDVTVFFCEILPNLPQGILYAIHDIALPRESFIERMYNEQHMLAAYILGGADGDELFFPQGYLGHYTNLLADKFIVLDDGNKLSLNAGNGHIYLRKSIKI